MSDALEGLCGRKIQKIEYIHDYVQLIFDGGEILNIFNALTVQGCPPEDLSQFLGSELCFVSVSKNSVSFVFNGGKSVCVGMSDEDYRGPEAIEYLGANGERIVWQ